MNKKLILALAFPVLVGCSHQVGYRSGAVPEVMIVADESGLRPSGVPTTITLVHPRPESMMQAIDLLLTRARARGAHFVLHLEAEWTEVRGEGAARCGARIRPVVLTGLDEKPPGAAPTGDPQGATQVQAYGRENWSDDLGIPGPEPLSRSRALNRYRDRPAIVGRRGWGLEMAAPVCVEFSGPADRRVTLEARLYR